VGKNQKAGDATSPIKKSGINMTKIHTDNECIKKSYIGDRKDLAKDAKNYFANFAQP
jgi:hypothetical protein